MTDAFLSSLFSFLSTNLDDLFVLMFLFMQARGKRDFISVLFGRYFGTAIIISVAIAGAYGLHIIPEKYIGLLGFVPITLGILERIGGTLTDYGVVSSRDGHLYEPVGLHPTLVSTFAEMVCKAWKDLGLYDKSHCYDESCEALDYAGKIVVIHPRSLTDEEKTPDNQLFLAKKGNGCKPLATGTAVFGTFLKTKKTESVMRGEIIGVIKLELLPEWAQRRFLEITSIDADSD